jgi:hypothetical protein
MERAASEEEEVVSGVSMDRTLLICVKFSNIFTRLCVIFPKSRETYNVHKICNLLSSLTPIWKIYTKYIFHKLHVSYSSAMQRNKCEKHYVKVPYSFQI